MTIRVTEWTRVEEIDMSYRSFGPNRYVCSVLEEMRDQLKLLDHDNLERYKSHTKMMIEEVQTLVNRMESALQDWDDLENLTKEKRQLKIKVKKLRKKLAELELQTDGSDNGED